MRGLMDNVCRRAALLAVLLATSLGALAPEQAGAAAAASSSRGTLVVKVADLPPGAAADVIVRGPGLSLVIQHSRVLHGLRPGRYTLTVRKVTLAARHRVRAGSLALPATPHLQVRVRANHTTTAHLRYGTIINPNVRLLTIVPLSVQGEAANPSAIVLRAPFRGGVGAILTARPSAALPGGLFHRVIGVRRQGRRVVLELRPAHLTEAFPQVDISGHVKFAPHKAVVSPASAAGFEPIVASLGMGNFRCSEPITGDQFGAELDFGLEGEVQFNIPTFFGIPTGLPEGKMELSMNASAALQALIAKNSGCSAFANLPPVDGAIPVGPVVVPVFAQLGIYAQASISKNLNAQASASANVTAGMEFHGFEVRNLSNANASATASLSGAGRLSIGPQLRLAVGVASVADVHFDVKPALAWTGNADGTCALELIGSTQLGISVGPFQLNEPLPAPSFTLYRCPQPPSLSITQSAPVAVFPNQAFEYDINVTNHGQTTAHETAILDSLPGAGAFVSSSAATSPPAPGPGGNIAIPIGDLAPGQTRTVAVRWRAPGGPATLASSASVIAANASTAGPANASVPVGTAFACNPCGATAAGTGLRNRERGSIAITGIPAGATVTRAVLIWGVLYGEQSPPDTITFNGHPIAADVTASSSGTLCWGDTGTVGYAADVTPYVTGNGAFQVSNPPNGEVRVDENPVGVLPYTDGATLVVFYNGGGADNQVLSDFSYNTNTDPTTGEAITRSFSGINSLGGPATLTLAGPDGQNNFGKVFTFTGAGEFSLGNPFEGNSPQEGPSFPIGNLWDTEVFEVGSILPSGQQALTFKTIYTGEDCIGVGAAVLQVAQHP